MLMKYIKHIGFWTMLILPSVVLGGSSIIATPTMQTLSNNIEISDIVLVVTLIAGLLTILSVAIGRQGKKPVIDDTFSSLKNEIKEDYKDLEDKILELGKIDAGAKIHDIQETLAVLDNTVNNLIKKKIYFLSEHFTSLEARVLDLDRHFDQASLDRKEDSRRITSEINTLRGNIREDINDVKDIIMKLMIALKTDDD